jgi:hypothetical protein
MGPRGCLLVGDFSLFQVFSILEKRGVCARTGEVFQVRKKLEIWLLATLNGTQPQGVSNTCGVLLLAAPKGRGVWRSPILAWKRVGM